MLSSSPANFSFIKDVGEFRQLLANQPNNYLLHTLLPVEKAKLQFEGCLDGVPVVWNACVGTVNHYLQQQRSLCDDPEQFINIEVVNGYHYLDVGLHLKQIDASALAKAIIMVRKYKRLHEGCFAFGAKSKTG